jgi:hypothetical protein
MPNMADITVKKADNATNIVYSALTPSSGDKVAAQWRSETAGLAAALRPTFSMDSQWNGPRTARRVNMQGQYPFTVTDTTTSITTVKARIPFNAQFTVPAEVPDTIVSEAVAQLTNMMASALAQSSIKSGFAPT